MQSNSEKKIDNLFDFMTFEEKTIYILSLSINRQTRDKAKEYESKLSLEQRLKITNIRFDVHLVLTDHSEMEHCYKNGETVDYQTVKDIQETLRHLVNSDFDKFLDDMVGLLITNEEREWHLLSALVWKGTVEEGLKKVMSYLTALDIVPNGYELSTIQTLTVDEVEIIKGVTNIDYIFEVEKKKFPDKDIKVIKEALKLALAIAEKRIQECELKKQTGLTEEDVNKREAILKERLKKVGLYDII